MNILIAGGTGFIGQNLIEKLVKAKHTVMVLSRSAKTSNNPFVTYRQWNGKEMPLAIGLYDVVINLAGASIAEKKWTDEYKQELRESRLLATEACVKYINGNIKKPQVFLNASAIGYYGGDAPNEANEETAAGTDFMATLCKDWEVAAQKASCRTVLMRIAVVLGKEGGAIKEMLPIYKMGLGGKFASGNQGWSWIHIEDLTNAMIWLMEKTEISGPVNLTSPKWETQLSFSRALAKAVHRPHIFIVPKFGLKLIFGERAILFWGGQKVVPKRLLESGFKFQYGEMTAALKSLVSA
jgi:uncharacterized protein (TIGR01777 family)